MSKSLTVLSGVGALNVNIPLETYEHARGDNITLPCSFTPSKPLTPDKLVIISWSAETLILTHYSTGHTDIKSLYEGRVSVDIDIPSGKANLKLSSITLTNSFIVPFKYKSYLIFISIFLVAPSTPICKIQGKTEYGQNINLTCLSEEGSPPPTYKWESRDVQNVPRLLTLGILSLYNISKETSGFYICTSSNKIRSATCNVTLAVMPPSMNIGSTAGIIAAVVAFLIILIIVIYCCCCRKKNKEEEYAMGDRNERYDDNHHYEDERRYNDHRDDRYDEPYDDRDKPPVPANKPPRRDYDD
uniref:Glycoprotein A33 (transmembrane), paralog a n=1 Tax=Seriola dumerili TaxID=41447 RepID=A0A3B4V0S1_SERDU